MNNVAIFDILLISITIRLLIEYIIIFKASYEKINLDYG